jgi:phospholipid/cholesterol/gamma-HCH transport system ATP-binding protein
VDEPTSGLDPVSAGEIDALILTLRASLGQTVMMITHDLNSLHATCDRIGAIAGGKIAFPGSPEVVLQA